MKRYDDKLKRNVYYINTYEGVENSCPHCGRVLDELDKKHMAGNSGQMNCLKCGNRLKA